MSDNFDGNDVSGTEDAAAGGQTAPADSQSQTALVVDESVNIDPEDGDLTGKWKIENAVYLRLDEISRMLDDSTSGSVLERVTMLESVANQQTKYFREWAKTGSAVSTLSGHVALLARAFCIMERRYGVTPENSMGEYLFKKMEGSIPDEMRRAAADAGFNMSLDETPQKITVKRVAKAPLSPQQTPAKMAKKDQYKTFTFEVAGNEFMSKEQPHIKTEGNMCISYIEGQAGVMLYMTSDTAIPEFPAPIVEAALKMVSAKPMSTLKGTEQHQAERLSLFVQHLLKLFIGVKMKLPVVVCAKLDPEAPGESLKGFAKDQGLLGGQLVKLGAAMTGLVSSDRKMTEADKISIVKVMKKSIIHLQQVQEHWAFGTGRFDVERYVSDEAGTSAIDVFDDN